MHTASLAEPAPLAAPEALGDGRYRLLYQLGRGGFGTVYCAFDTRYSVPVAIKILHRREAESLFRFKAEFRNLAEVTHQNLVQLYELSSENELWFVVMEHIAGIDLCRYLFGRHRPEVTITLTAGPPAPTPTPSPSPTPRIDEGRLRSTFIQLTRGLMALHAAGKLHRDIKPSNVLVTEEGRVVILDFGLVLDVGEQPGALAGQRIGTPGYMSPEQVCGGRLTTAGDWYAVGAMLCEVLTGTRALDGRAARGSGPLHDLAWRLVNEHPAERPGGAEILAVLGAPDAPAAPLPVRGTELVGRGAELEALDAVFEQAQSLPVLLRVSGASGVGKTALLDVWLRRLGSTVWVLRGRCLEREDLPFKALDGVVDALATHLLAEPVTARAAMLPPSLEEAARMFPVLAGLEQRDASPRSDAPARRERAFACLCELVTRAARVHPLVLCIDDAQWGDADSARLVAQLLQPSTRGVLVVVLQRPAADRDSFPVVLDEWLAHCPAGVVIRDVRLRELGGEDARSLAVACLGQVGSSPVVERIVHEAGGNPFFIRQLAGSALESDGAMPGGRFPELLERKLASLSSPLRRFVEVVALAARPLSEEVVMRAAQVAGAEARSVLRGAESSRLISSLRVEGQTLLESAHDRIREEVARLMPVGTTREHHARIADAMVAMGESEPERLLPHCLGAADDERASEVALEAARRAGAALAFERAADHYALVLRLGRRTELRGELLEQRGEMLSNAGRCAEAAEAVQEAAQIMRQQSPAMPAVRALDRRSGELWLRSGYVDRGLGTFRELLAGLGVRVPASEKAALRTALWLRLRLILRGRRFRQRADIPMEKLERLDALWGAATSLGMLKPLSADVFQLRHLLEALNLGDSLRVMRSLVYEAPFESLIGGVFFDRRCREMIAEMMDQAERSGQPWLRAWALQGRGMAGWFHGDWRRAWEDCQEAVRLYVNECRGVSWELAVCDVYRLSALTYLGRIGELIAIVPEAHRAARERGDRYATANLAFFESFLLLAQDRCDQAIQLARRAIEPFPRSDFLAIHYGIGYALVQGELYRGDARAAWELIEREWPAWRASGMASLQSVRVEIRYLRARAATALLGAGEAGAKHRAVERTLTEDIKRLERDRCSPARPLAQAMRAAWAMREARGEDARALLGEAAEGFERNGMSLHAAAARHHRALLGGPPTDDEERVAVEGVARPRAMFQLVIPGFGGAS